MNERSDIRAAVDMRVWLKLQALPIADDARLRAIEAISNMRPEIASSIFLVHRGVCGAVEGSYGIERP